jgi:hypothetical protein
MAWELSVSVELINRTRIIWTRPFPSKPTWKNVIHVSRVKSFVFQ